MIRRNTSTIYFSELVSTPKFDFSFDRIKLLHFPLVIEFPLSNLQRGTQAQLGLEFPVISNQIWTLTEGESYSQELSLR